MATDTAERHEHVRQALRRLDLYHHSLRLVGEGLLAQAGESSVSPSHAPHVRSLQLIEECLTAVQDLGDYLDREDVGLHESVLGQIELGFRRASRAKTHTMHTVSVWRVIEVSDRFLGSIAGHYDYQRLSEGVPPETMDGDDVTADALSKLFAEYEDAMATKAEPRTLTRPPFSHGVLRWRGSQLFYVQRVEDGARWIELDPNFERRGITEEAGEVETSEARTIDGYPISLSLDLVVDEHEVDRYIRSQWGREHYVFGYQIAEEMAAKASARSEVTDEPPTGADDSG